MTEHIGGLSREQVILLPDVLDDEVTRMLWQGYAPGRVKTSGYSPGYVKSTATAVKSWLSYWNVGLTRKIRVPAADDPVTLADEKVPERQAPTDPRPRSPEGQGDQAAHRQDRRSAAGARELQWN